MKTLKFFSIVVVSITLISCKIFPQSLQDEKQSSFSFVFCTDIHVEPERNAVQGFTQAIDTINKLNPAFVITGGDLIMDALGQSYGRADSLYNIISASFRKI